MLCFLILNKDMITSGDGEWAHWGAWSSCSKSCGDGVHFRDRSCSDPAPMGTGKDCIGPGSEVTGCFKAPCNGKSDRLVLFSSRHVIASLIG